MPLIIKDAIQRNLKARIGLLAPTGGGKTFTGLRWLFAMKALGMANRIGVIDTEHGSASKYKRDFGTFRVIEMSNNFSPEQYIEAMTMLAEDGVDALLIDSLTHAWSGKGGSLETKDKLGKQRGYNDYTAWGPVTAMQNRMIEAMLGYPGHLITTMRLKMEYVLEEDPITKRNVVRKVGLQPIQRDGMEYEFDVVGDLDQEHVLTISKTRCSPLDGFTETKPSDRLVKILRTWLESDEAQEAKAAPVHIAPAPAAETPEAPAHTEAQPEAPTDAMLEEIKNAADQAALDALIEKAQGLPESQRGLVRARWIARRNELKQGQAA